MRVPVRFELPPVVEVVCGVLFSTLRRLKAPQVGLFWQAVRGEFPRIEEAPPIASLFESSQDGQIHTIQFDALPPLRRTWLLSADGRNLIQIQEDRFLFNWKRAADDDSYPSYDGVIQKFDRYLAEYVNFLEKEGIGKPTYRQFELTYVNHIGNANGLAKVGEGGILADHIRDATRSRFLPDPEGFNWTTAYALPDGVGRLHLIAQSAVHTPGGERIVRLDLTARGIPSDSSETGRRSWFDIAHEWITHGFADATSPVLHKEVWRRTS
jgi:uncharacterized protein (TIGR04255 family)